MRIYLLLISLLALLMSVSACQLITTRTGQSMATEEGRSNMVFIKGGTFEMGDTFGNGSDNQQPVHRVTVSDFYLGRHEVTFAEYDAFCRATEKNLPDDEEWGRGERPAINVDWLDAITYCNWLSEQHNYQAVYRISGDTVTANWQADGYRLPTEAEWEFAARSRGQQEKFAGTSEEHQLHKYVNFCDQSCTFGWKTEGRHDGFATTAPVGQLMANKIGLYDMTGNVFEWCWDWYARDYYQNSPRRDPKGPDSGSSRVIRSGMWNDTPDRVRCTSRHGGSPDFKTYGHGFRLARAER